MKSFWSLLVVLLLAVFLRFWLLSDLPNGLHWDEMDTGYQAYSLLETGKDYFGNTLPLFPHSLADFRTPVFIYSAVPWVAKFGLTAFSVRLPALIWGLIAITSFYLLAHRLFHSRLAAFISSLGLSLSVWHLIYSRKSVETGSLLALTLLSTTLFIRGLRRPVYLMLSGLFFSLSTLTYSPGKLFIPFLVLCLIVIYRKDLSQISRKYLIVSFLILAIFSAPGYLDAVIGDSGLRLSHLAVWTDPTIASQVDQKRLEYAVSSGRPREVGLTPGLVEKILYNKPALWIGRIVTNYFSTFSTDFLFTKGDPELRHSPGRDSVGMLHLAEVIPFVLGFLYLSIKRASPSSKLILFWLLFAPLPSALTRDGGTHAARLLILLPALLLTIAAGVTYVLKKPKLVLASYSLIFVASAFSTLAYFYSSYRHESAEPYQWGYPQMIQRALKESPSYSRVLVDFRTDSPLMAYLFATQLDPAKFQAMNPLSEVQITPDLRGLAFDNVYLVNIGSRFWTNITLPKGTLVITHAKQPLADQINPKLDVVKYPDSTEAFFIFAK